MDLRRELIDIYSAGIEAAGGRRCVRARLQTMEPPPAVALVAVGKAAEGMALGALDAWGGAVKRGLVITRHGYAGLALQDLPGIELITAGHPVPDEGSLRAGRALVEFVAAEGEDEAFLFLVSGGTSALVEVLPDGVALDDLAHLNRWLVASGLPIGEINAVRRRLSMIKGGRLARRLAGRRCDVLAISDVPGDVPADIGSGLLVPSAARPLPDGLPDEVRRLLDRAPRAPEPGDAGLADVRFQVVANVETALQACATSASTRGWTVHRHAARLSGDVADASRRIVDAVDGQAGLHLWGGEVTVALPASPGRGGRCQQLALLCAAELAGRDGVAVLCAGTDGADGPGEDAGAMVDGATVQRGRDAGLDVTAAIRGADAGRFLEASGDLLSTGPTDTNVTDVVIATSGKDRRAGTR